MPKLHNLKSSFCHQQKPQQVKELTLDKFTNDSIPFKDDTNKKLEFERLFQLLPLIFPDEESRK